MAEFLNRPPMLTVEGEDRARDYWFNPIQQNGAGGYIHPVVEEVQINWAGRQPLLDELQRNVGLYLSPEASFFDPMPDQGPGSLGAILAEQMRRTMERPSFGSIMTRPVNYTPWGKYGSKEVPYQLSTTPRLINSIIKWRRIRFLSSGFVPINDRLGMLTLFGSPSAIIDREEKRVTEIFFPDLPVEKAKLARSKFRDIGIPLYRKDGKEYLISPVRKIEINTDEWIEILEDDISYKECWKREGYTNLGAYWLTKREQERTRKIREERLHNLMNANPGPVGSQMTSTINSWATLPPIITANNWALQGSTLTADINIQPRMPAQFIEMTWTETPE